MSLMTRMQFCQERETAAGSIAILGWTDWVEGMESRLSMSAQFEILSRLRDHLLHSTFFFFFSKLSWACSA